MKTFFTSVLCLAAIAVQAAPPPPANDNFANRIDIVASGSVTVSGVNAKATSEAGDPTIDGDVAFKSVWWTWTAPFNGPATITTHGSSFDTLLGVFTGNALASLVSVAESDDANGLYTSSVVFNSVGGVPYSILVAGFNGAGGKVKLNVQVSAGPCTFSLNPSSRSMAYTTGSSSVVVTATTGCTWSAVSNDSWLTITAGSSGSGSGTVSYSIAANVALTSRTGTLTTAGLTHTVTQAAAPACTYSITPTSASFTAAPVTNSFTMSAGTGCAWTATPNASWITIQSGASGTGNGTTTYVVATNTLSNSRSGTITSAGQTHTVNQSGSIPCSYSISPTSASIAAAGASANITISTQGGCSWTASSPATWVTFSTTNGTGNATVSYTVSDNASTVARNTTLTVAGISYAVSQSGAACNYALTPTSVSVAAGVSTGTVTVTSGTGCAWSAVANDTWFTITSGASGIGNGTVGYSVAANSNTAIRAGTLTIGGQTFTVNQAAAACTYSIAPTAAHYSDASGTGSIAVTSGTGCAWTAVANDAFITINSGTPGSGNGTVSYTAAANVTTTSRTGTITVAGATFTVTQDGTAPCSYGITPSSASYTSTGGSSSVAVTANSGCTWSASSAASWVTISTPSGSGNGTVPYTVAANSSSISRSGTLTIAGNPFTVTQTGAPCTYSISPTSASYTSVGGSGSVTVTATSGCSWTTSSDVSWLTVTSGASGTGNGSVVYAVASSSVSTNRTGRLTIAGRIFSVTQTAAPCVFSIDPTSASFPETGGASSIALTASDAGCAWTATANVSWITLLAPVSGTDDATINFTVTPTTVVSTRSGQITVGGQVFSVTQAGDTIAPTVTITAPANGSTVSNVITLSATATDNISISRVDFYRDAGSLLGSDVTSPYAMSYATTNVANGAHTFYMRGFDPAGNQGSSTTNSVTVSNGSSASTNQWVSRFGSTGTDTGLAVATDSSANIVLGGAYTGSVDFGTGVLTNAGFEDGVIAHYNSAGTANWSMRFGNTGRDRAYSVAADTSGNVIAGGTYSGSVSFGGSTLTNAGIQDIFVAKYNSAGVHQWSKGFGSTGEDICYDVAIDSTGAVIITGGFSNTINFGGTNLTSTVGFDFYIAKFSAAGAHLWSRKAAGNGQEFGLSVAVDSSGNAVVTGQFNVGIDFGSGFVTTAGSEDVFLTKFLGADGSLSWSKKFGSTGVDRGNGVVADSSGNITMTGVFNGTVNFGGSSLTTTVGAIDTFLAQYLSAGTHVWSKRLTSGSTTVSGNSLAVDASKNLIVAGYFQGTTSFEGQSMSSAGGSDVFASKYSSAGVRDWTRSCGGSVSDVANAVSIDQAGYPAVTGTFAGTASFIGSTLTTAGQADIFLLKLNP